MLSWLFPQTIILTLLGRKCSFSPTGFSNVLKKEVTLIRYLFENVKKEFPISWAYYKPKKIHGIGWKQSQYTYKKKCLKSFSDFLNWYNFVIWGTCEGSFLKPPNIFSRKNLKRGFSHDFELYMLCYNKMKNFL